MLFYLSGAIEYAPDRGTGWRAEISPFLQALGHQVYDPAADHRKNLTEDEAQNFRRWKTDDLPRFQRTIRKIIAWDLDWIEHKAGCVLAYWDQYSGRGAGSQAELTLAHRRGLPVYLVCGMPVSEVSGWILGCATEVFRDFEELRAFLLKQSGPGDARPGDQLTVAADR
ncbi:MAG TPA: hypothetical protein VFA60_16130 [Terriglobales bacterium]|nr:hypothetical protein [Terriglobales bacterium]